MAKPPNPAPIAVLVVSNLTPKVGEVVTFDPTQSHDPNGPLKMMDLHFGDDLLRVPVEVREYAWASPGEKAVELVVYDEQNKPHNTVQTVTVQGEPVPGPVPGIPPTITEQPQGVTVPWGQQALV